VGNATDDGLTSSSSAARDTPPGGDAATIGAKRTFHSYVTMHVETESQHDLQLALHSRSLGSTCGAQNLANVLIVSGAKQSAEPTAQPHIRIAPIREQRLKTLVRVVMDARCEVVGKPAKSWFPGDLNLMPDGGCNIKGKLRNLFVDETPKWRGQWPARSMCTDLRMAWHPADGLHGTSSSR
jgi:hypothetical protein